MDSVPEYTPVSIVQLANMILGVKLVIWSGKHFIFNENGTKLQEQRPVWEKGLERRSEAAREVNI